MKTTAAKQPQSVRITSERQLDATGVGHLFLHVVVVDEREFSPGAHAPGQSLSGLVEEIRGAVASAPIALAEFNDRLLDAGWLDSQASRYEGRSLTVRREITYRVSEGFPRLTERFLPEGVGDVNYALTLAACEAFTVSTAEMAGTLSQ